ncbi:PPC domain-containing DNA-binding protein [Halococcus agarilyticus]|uniref:PPC domain-containing DNA-binding protein n=1 Tax=Halococcus agarilyticus TaxID=1232219 RepID=UPI000677BD5B|nr:PPC domain-containing DNA-binding protein [Halococcus agarilyticus]
MDYQALDAGREFVARLDTGADWRSEIEALAADAGVDAGFFFGLGAVQDAELYFYDQDEKEYDAIEFDEPLEVAACVGNVSWLDGERFAHTHAVCSREDGSTVAGHLNAGTVFAGEIYLREFDAHLEREHDPTTDLDLWPF